jgi:hypothetical protein
MECLSLNKTINLTEEMIQDRDAILEAFPELAELIDEIKGVPPEVK